MSDRTLLISSMRRITFDIETIGTFQQGDWSQLEVSVVGVYDSQSKKLTSYIEEEFKDMWPLFESADFLVGFNSEHFDIPILNKYYAGDLSKIRSVDLLKEVKNVLGRRLKLDNLAEATLGVNKSGHGLQAVEWWEQGLVDKVRQYCMDDVKITDDLYKYAKKHGKLKYKDYDGVREIKLDTSSWEAPSAGPALTHTLPF